jgi:hypothetical protein
MAGTTRVLTFAEGITVSGPSQNFLETTKFAVYAGTAAYIAAKGAAATYGDVFADSTDYKIKFYNGTMWQIIDTTKNNTNAILAPTINDDFGNGYIVGSKWFDTTNDKIYMAIDVTVGAAIWLEYGGPFIGYHEIPGGSVNGINDAFTISYLPTDGTLIVYKNGLKVPASDYTFVNPTITFSTPPAIATKVEVFYITIGVSATTQLILDWKVETRAVTAGEITAKKLTLANTPAVASEVLLQIRSGVPQAYGYDYNIINSNQLNWSGLGLEGQIITGSVLIISYFA